MSKASSPAQSHPTSPAELGGDASETAQAISGRKRRAATAREIVDATKRLLAAGAPVVSLSAEQITAEAGLSRATFYLHFRDKHALIAQLAEEETAWRDEIGAEALADPNLTRQTLDHIMRSIVGRWQTDRAVLSAIIELAEYDPAVRETWRSAIHDVATTAAREFHKRWDNTPHRPADPDTIAEIFSWMFERSCHQLLTAPDRAEPVADGMAEIIWRVLDYPARDERV